MSRHILGLFAIVIAISLAAFTTPQKAQKPLTDFYFAFDIVNNLPTQQNVEDPALWLQVADISGCDDVDQMACRIEVPETTTDAGTPRTLKSSTVINTQQSSTDVYYVVQGGSVTQESNSQH